MGLFRLLYSFDASSVAVYYTIAGGTITLDLETGRGIKYLFDEKSLKCRLQKAPLCGWFRERAGWRNCVIIDSRLDEVMIHSLQFLM